MGCRMPFYPNEGNSLMNCSRCRWRWCAGLLLVGVALGSASALCGEAAKPQAAKAQPAESGPYRKLAAGVMRSVDSPLGAEDVVSRHDVVELVAVDPKLDWAKDVAFRNEVSYLEFQFKPVRMILVDVPQPNGRMKQKLIWYMVYRVTNPGKVLRSVEGADGTYELQLHDSAKPIQFIPEFRLECQDLGKTYRDRLIPIAVAAIQMREDPNRKFYNSVEMAREVKAGETVWGVATWEDVDPRTDRFSVYVSGLTNAYKWADTAPVGPGDPIGKGRKFTRKTLKLNFWRPGDEFFPHEKEIRYGGIPGGVDYEWLYQ
jgi:hypothetical protein